MSADEISEATDAPNSNLLALGRRELYELVLVTQLSLDQSCIKNVINVLKLEAQLSVSLMANHNRQVQGLSYQNL